MLQPVAAKNDFHINRFQLVEYLSYLQQLKKDFHFSSDVYFKPLWI